MANEIIYNMRTRNSKGLYTSYFPKFKNELEEQQFLKKLEMDGALIETIINEKGNKVIHYNVSNKHFMKVWDKWGFKINVINPIIG